MTYDFISARRDDENKTNPIMAATNAEHILDFIASIVT